MTDQSKTSSPHHRRNHRGPSRQLKKHDDQVYLITGASESVVADAKRKNGFYAITIGVRIASLFAVLITDGWLQIAVFVTGMIAPWIGVQIANNIRQVDGRSIEPIPPQQAALEAASHEAEASEDDTVIVGDVVDDDTYAAASPSAESDARTADVGENEMENDDTRS